MRFSLLLLGEHPPARLVRMARLAEDHGFEDLWMADEKFYRDPFVSLTYIARQTRVIRLGTCVTDPFTRHPALTAMAAGTLDEVSGGRAVLGIGAGFSGLEAMGIRRTQPVRALREAIGLIRRLWAGETVSVENEAFAMRQGSLGFKARRDIPILIASAGPQVLRLAGEVADEIMLGDLASKSVLHKAIAEVRRGAQRVNRAVEEIPLIARLNLVLSDDVRAAVDAVRPWILTNLWHAYPKWENLFDHAPDWEERLEPLKNFLEARGGKPRNVGDREQLIPYAHLITEEMVRSYALAGDAHSLARQVEEIASQGVNGIALYPTPLPGQEIESVLEDFLGQVIPQLRIG